MSESGERQMATRTEPQSQGDFNDYVAAELRELKQGHATLKASTDEIVDILRMAKTFFRMANFFGVAMKWLAGIIAAGVVIYNALRGHK